MNICLQYNRSTKNIFMMYILFLSDFFFYFRQDSKLKTIHKR